MSSHENDTNNKIQGETGSSQHQEESCAVVETKPEVKSSEAQLPDAPVYVTAKVFYQAIVVVSLVASALSTVVYDRFFATKIAVFDFPGYLMSVRDKMALAGNTASAEQILVAGLNEAEKIVKSVPKNYVVISGDAVLGDSKPALVLYRYPKKAQPSAQAPTGQQADQVAPVTPAE